MGRALAPRNRTTADEARGLSVRGHLAVIVAVIGLTLAGLSVLQASHDFRRARSEAGTDLSFTARLAAEALDDSVAEARSFTVQTASDPSMRDLFEHAEQPHGLCSLTGSSAGLFPAGAVHYLDTDGRVFCSSASDTVRGSEIGYGTMPWFHVAIGTAPDRPVDVAPFVDPVTGERSIAFAAPVHGGDGAAIGLVVHALPISGIAGLMAGTFGGPDDLGFDVTWARTGALVSTSEDTDGDVTGPAVDLRDPPHEAVAGPDGTRRIYRAAPAQRAGLIITAGIEEAHILADARDELWGHMRLTLLALLVAVVLGLLVNRRVGAPLRRLSTAVEQAGRTVTPEPVAVGGPREVRDLVDRFNSMIAVRLEMEDQLRQRVMFDELTGLPNRVVAIDRLTQALERTRRDATSVAVLSVDVDRFSLVNESLGRDAGDRLLVQLARGIRSVLEPDDTVARFYGDEFVVVREGVSTREEAAAFASRIAEVLRVPLRDGALEATVSVSIGIALGRHEDGTAETLLRDADAATARAKQRGKARFEFYERSMRDGARSRLHLENELRRAIERDELSLAYQPLVNPRTGRVVGAEALVRWNHPERGVVLPGAFIDLAEETGLIVPIGRRALEQACRQAAEWDRQGHRIRVSVNLSPRQISEPGLEAEVRRILDEVGLDPSRLCIEITENILMREDSAADALMRLRRLGVAISVDDFGTGYSSLAYLQRFQVDELKIDRSFTHALGTSPSASALVAAIVGMGRALGLSVVAEGVEEPAQMEAVRALGCDAAQGFLIMKPEPPGTVALLLERDHAGLTATPYRPTPAPSMT